MFAIIETGGKQYKVQEGDVVFVEKLNAADGDTVTFDRVFAVSDGETFQVGTPVVDSEIARQALSKMAAAKKFTS